MSARPAPPPPPAGPVQPQFSFRTTSNRSVQSSSPAPMLGSLVTVSNRRLVRLKSKRAIHERDDFYILLFASFWLCFNAGFINIVSLSSYLNVATAHVTGLVARSSSSIADGEWGLLKLPATTFFCFLLGAVFGGLTISHDSFYLGRSYGRALIIIALLQGSALLVDKVHSNKGHGQRYFVYACACAMGLQNSLTSKYSGNTLRTTHATGATTDLGIAIGHYMTGRYEDMWKIKLHGTAILGFLVGGIAGRLAYIRYQELALVFNVSMTTFLGCAHLVWVSRREQLSVWKIMKSRTDVKVHHSHSHPHHATPLSTAAAAHAHAGSSLAYPPAPPSQLASVGKLPSGPLPPGYSRTVSLMALQRVNSSINSNHDQQHRQSTASFSGGSSNNLHTPASAPLPTHPTLSTEPPIVQSRASLGMLGRLISQRCAGPDNPSDRGGSRSSRSSTAPSQDHDKTSRHPQGAASSTSSLSPPPPPPTAGGELSLSPALQPVNMVSFRGLPLLNEEMSQRLVQVDVEVLEEEDDDLLSDGGDVDEYSVGDVAGEASDDEFDYLRDPVTGGLVEVVVEMDEEGMREEEGGNGGQPSRRQREWGEGEEEGSVV